MALIRRDNGTRVTSGGIDGVTDAVTEDDPLLTVTHDLQHSREFASGGSDRTDKASDDYVTLAFRAGEQVRRSALLAMMTPASVESLTPASGPAAGGTSVTLRGSGLDGVTGITVGGAAATNRTVVDPRTVTFTTPAGTAGARDVVVTDDAGAVTLTGGFTYTA